MPELFAGGNHVVERGSSKLLQTPNPSLALQAPWTLALVEDLDVRHTHGAPAQGQTGSRELLQPGSLVSASPHDRNRGQNRKLQHLLYLFHATKGGIKIIDEECIADAENKAHHGGQS